MIIHSARESASERVALAQAAEHVARSELRWRETTVQSLEPQLASARAKLAAEKGETREALPSAMKCAQRPLVRALSSSNRDQVFF